MSFPELSKDDWERYYNAPMDGYARAAFRSIGAMWGIEYFYWGA